MRTSNTLRAKAPDKGPLGHRLTGPDGASPRIIDTETKSQYRNESLTATKFLRQGVSCGVWVPARWISCESFERSSSLGDSGLGSSKSVGCCGANAASSSCWTGAAYVRCASCMDEFMSAQRFPRTLPSPEIGSHLAFFLGSKSPGMRRDVRESSPTSMVLPPTRCR